MIDESFKELLEKVDEDLKNGRAKIYFRPDAEETEDENLSRANPVSNLRREI